MMVDSTKALDAVLDALAGSQQQCDEDGMMIAVSRQALDEALTLMRERLAQPAGDAVAVVAGDYAVRELQWENSCRAFDLPVGTKLYTAPPVAAGEARDAALAELTAACEAEFCCPDTEEHEPDDSMVSHPEDRCHITFGMIRRARAALTQEQPK